MMGTNTDGRRNPLGLDTESWTLCVFTHGTVVVDITIPVFTHGTVMGNIAIPTSSDADLPEVVSTRHGHRLCEKSENIPAD